MSAVHDVLAAGLITWLALLAGFILIRMLDGSIRTSGLFQTKLDFEQGTVNPERVLAALAVPLVLGGYVLEIIQTGTVTLADGTLSLPDIPESLLAILAASNGTYLAGKISRSQ